MKALAPKRYMQLRAPNVIVAICLITAISVAFSEAQQRTPIILSEDGVGPLHKNTEATVEHIRTLFPGLKVVASTDVSEGIEFPTIEVRDRTTVLLEILPDQDKRIRGVVIKSPTIQYGLGLVGFHYSQIFGEKVDRDLCSFGSEEYSSNVICDSNRKSHIAFIFEEVASGPNYEFPGINQLRSARVKEISWNPHHGN